MKIYVSLPITGIPIEEAKQKADSVKRKLSELGHNVVTPFDVCPEENKPYSYYMGKDIETIIDSDAIFLCDDWIESKGCMLEYYAARIYGKIVYDGEITW